MCLYVEGWRGMYGCVCLVYGELRGRGECLDVGVVDVCMCDLLHV